MSYQAKDTFEIDTKHGTDHPPGLVVVLDRQIASANLHGTVAAIRSPYGVTSCLRIDDVKDHLESTSLFFRGKTIKDVPVDSQIEIGL